MIPLFILGHFSHHVLTAITIPLMPFIRSTFDLDYTQSGFVLSAFTLAYGFGQLPAGWLADRIEPRKLLTAGIAGVALAGILVGLSQTYLPMVVFLVLMGILAGGYHPAAPPLISALGSPGAPGDGRSASTTSAAGASNILTPLIAVALANAWGWRNAYLGMAIPTFFFGIFFYLMLGRLTAREKANPSGGAGRKARQPARAGKHGPHRRLPDPFDLHGGGRHVHYLVHPADHGRPFPPEQRDGRRAPLPDLHGGLLGGPPGRLFRRPLREHPGDPSRSAPSPVR